MNTKPKKKCLATQIRLTKKCLEMWRWLALTGAKEKRSALERMGVISSQATPHNECYFCQLVGAAADLKYDRACENCPGNGLLWEQDADGQGRYDGRYGCELDEDSVYKLWIRGVEMQETADDPTQEQIGHARFVRQFAARRMVAGIKIALAKMQTARKKQLAAKKKEKE